MELKNAEKASDLFKELKTLKHYKLLKESKEYSNVVHFEVVQHYGSAISDYNKVVIDDRHNKRFFDLLETIINEIEAEIASL